MDTREQLYNTLKETFILLDDGDRQLFNHFNLTSPRYYTLYHIYQSPGISSSALSDRMLCDKSNVSRIIRGLENDEMIVRKPHETDRRSFCLYLTEKGTAVFQKVEAAHQTFNTFRLACLDETVEAGLITNLSKLNQSLKDSMLEKILTSNGTLPNRAVDNSIRR